MEEIIKIQMGTCACHDKENEKPRRMRKLKSSKLKKELQSTRTSKARRLSNSQMMKNLLLMKTMKKSL